MIMSLENKDKIISEEHGIGYLGINQTTAIICAKYVGISERMSGDIYLLAIAALEKKLHLAGNKQ